MTAESTAVEAFLRQRPEYVRVLRNSRGSDGDTDFWRWQGHAEARRQLCEQIGGTCRCGYHTSRGAS
jgi:hypothetical protein